MILTHPYVQYTCNICIVQFTCDVILTSDLPPPYVQYIYQSIQMWRDSNSVPAGWRDYAHRRHVQHHQVCPPPPIHTHTCKCSHARARTRTYTQTVQNILTWVPYSPNTHTHTRTHTHTYTYTHTHTHAYTHGQEGQRSTENRSNPFSHTLWEEYCDISISTCAHRLYL